MLEVEQSIDRYVLRAGDLRLAFQYEHDRWQHELAIRGDSGWQTLLTSSEGLPEEAVPVSPPFQDLRLETIDDQTREFQLFGQGGQGAYSAAIRFEGAAQTVSFDVAARGTRIGATICMQSTYEVPPTSTILRKAEPGGLEIRGDAGGVLLFASPAGLVLPDRPAENPTGATTLAAGPFVNDVSGTTIVPRNIRWQYRVGRTDVP